MSKLRTDKFKSFQQALGHRAVPSWLVSSPGVAKPGHSGPEFGAP